MKNAVYFAVLFLLTACGDNGGSVPTPSINVNSTPTTTISSVPATTYKISGTVSGLNGVGLSLRNSYGEDISVNSNGTFSVNSDVLSGRAYAVTIKTQPTAPNQTCTVSNGSGTVTNTNVTNISILCTNDPIPISNFSYENKIAYTQYFLKQYGNIDTPDIKSKNVNPLTEEMGFSTRAIAYADFENNGTLDAITVSVAYKNIYPNDNTTKWADSPGRVFILRKEANGWTDVSDKLFKNATSRYTCISSLFIGISDFNHDSRPDAIISCTGIDFKLNGKWTDDQLSLQYEVLSQPDGGYIVQPISQTKVYGHQTAIGDINYDGNPDIIVTDPVYTGHPIIYWGKGDGSFIEDLTNHFPSETQRKSIYSVQILPINGSYQVMLSGATPGSSFYNPTAEYGTKLFTYQDGYFRQSLDLTKAIPNIPDKSYSYLSLLDVVISGDYIYGNMIDYTVLNHAIIKINFITGVGEYIWQGSLTTQNFIPYGNSITYFNGKIINFVANCGSANLLSSWYNHCSYQVSM